MKKALIVIDVQNDYFPGGLFPLWNTESTLANILEAMEIARSKSIPIVLIQHVADQNKGPSPFFNEGSEGVRIHQELLKAAPEGILVKKTFADSFHRTELEKTLLSLGVSELLICGMMTQNCVTHTAISKEAEKYEVKVLTDCCTTVDEAIHQIALHGMSHRITLGKAAQFLSDQQ